VRRFAHEACVGSCLAHWSAAGHRGGRWSSWKADKSGTIVGGFDSELLELAEDERLAFRWGFIGPEGREGPSFDTLLTVTLRPDPNGTVLNLVHEQLDELAAAMPHIANAVESGWKAFLDNLARVLASTNGRGSPADEV